MANNRNNFLFGLLFLLAACGRTSLSTKEYTQWVQKESNGLHRSKSIADVTVEMQYKPLDYILAEEIERGQLKAKDIEKRRKELDGLQYVDLKISNLEGTSDVRSEEQQQSLMYYYSFQFQNDITLEEGSQSSPCVLYHFERTYRLKDKKSFVLAFPKSKFSSSEDKCLVIDSRELGLGKLKINIDRQALEKIPTLAL